MFALEGGQREDHKIAFAGEDDAEEAAIWRDGKFAKGEIVKNGLRSGLEHGNFLAGLVSGKRRDGDPDDVGGFSFGGAFEQDALFIGRPMKDAEAHAEANEMVGDGDVANFQVFAVDEIGDFCAAGRNGQAPGVAIERGDFGGVLGEKFEALEAGRAAHRAVAFDGNGGVGAGDAIGVEEGAAFECEASRTGRDIVIAERKKHARFYGFGHVDDGGIVLEPGGVE